MFLRLGVYQDLCREHAKSSLWMLNRARNQSSFLQGRGSIISLSAGFHHPPPAVSSRTPAQRARGGMGLGGSSLQAGWVLWGQSRLCCVPTAGASAGGSPWQSQSCGQQGSFSLLDTQSKQKYLISPQAEDLNSSCCAGKFSILWNEKLSGVLLRSQRSGTQVIMQTLQVQPWLPCCSGMQVIMQTPSGAAMTFHAEKELLGSPKGAVWEQDRILGSREDPWQTVHSRNLWPIFMTLPWNLLLGRNSSLWNPLSWGIIKYLWFFSLFTVHADKQFWD